MRRVFFFLIIGFMCSICFGTNYDTDFSTQDYIDYLDSLQNAPKKAVEDNSFGIDVFDLGKIKKEFSSLFSLQTLNTGKWQAQIRETKHASLIVFFIGLGGIIILLKGYKLLPILIMAFGAWLGALTTYNIINTFLQVSKGELLLFVILGTIIATVAALLLKNTFILLFGAIFGVAISQLILALFSLTITNPLVFMLFIAALFAVLVLLLKRLFIIFLTSLAGSIMCVFAAQYLFLELFQSLSYQDDFVTYTSIVFFLILIITGFFLQFKTTGQPLVTV